MIASNRLKSRPKLDKLLRQYYWEDGAIPVAPDECPFEEQIQAATRCLHFDSVEKEHRFAENLRMVCMIYRLLPEVNPRSPFHSNAEVKKAIRMRAKAVEWRDKYIYIGDGVRRLMDLVLSREKLAWTYLTWSRSEAISSLAVQLESLFPARRVKNRWQVIADLLVATFDLDEEGGWWSENEEKWARQLVYRNEHRARSPQYPAEFAEKAKYILIDVSVELGRRGA